MKRISDLRGSLLTFFKDVSRLVLWVLLSSKIITSKTTHRGNDIRNRFRLLSLWLWWRRALCMPGTHSQMIAAWFCNVMWRASSHSLAVIVIAIPLIRPPRPPRPARWSVYAPTKRAITSSSIMHTSFVSRVRSLACSAIRILDGGGGRVSYSRGPSLVVTCSRSIVMYSMWTLWCIVFSVLLHRLITVIELIRIRKFCD